MAVRITRRQKVAVSRAVHPLYRRVVRTYLAPTGIELREIPFARTGTTDLAALGAVEELAAVAVQSPNFFGCIEDLQVAADRAHAGGALCVAAFTEPLAFGLLKSPGSQGADIACGEGQSLGIPRSFGGPGLGMFAAGTQYVRNMPGRLVGETVGPGGAARLRAHAGHARAAHPPREGDLEHLLQQQPLRADRRDLHGLPRGHGHAGAGPAQLRQERSTSRAHLRDGRGAPAALPAPPSTSSSSLSRRLRRRPTGGCWTRRSSPGCRSAPTTRSCADHYLLCVTETMRQGGDGPPGAGGAVMSDFLGTTGLILNEPLLWERGQQGPLRLLAARARTCERRDPAGGAGRATVPDFPDLSEVDVVRHYTRLSTGTSGSTPGMYPLGSCTMKYNPKTNERQAAHPGIRRRAPAAAGRALPGGAAADSTAWSASWPRSRAWTRSRCSRRPGAHGELAGMLIFHAYHRQPGQAAHQDPHPRHGPRHQPGERRPLRLRVRAGHLRASAACSRRSRWPR